MVEKAKLDLLENPSEIEIADIINSTDDQTDPARPVVREKWALNKLFLIAAPAVIAVCIITGVLLFYMTRTNNTVARTHSGKMAGTGSGTSAVAIDKRNSEKVGAVGTPAAVAKTKVTSAHFKDFIIDLKDKAGGSRILLCDVVFDLSAAGQNEELEKREDIRSLIYQTLTGRNAIVLRSLEERKRLKKELLQEASKVLGEGIVKNIYFTNYVIM